MFNFSSPKDRDLDISPLNIYYAVEGKTSSNTRALNHTIAEEKVTSKDAG